MSFFNKPLYARDYRLASEKKCNQFASTLAVIYLVYVALTLAFSAVFELPFFKINVGNTGEVSMQASWGSILAWFYTGHFAVGLIAVSAKIYKDKKPEVNDLFEGFKNYGNILGVYILQQIYIGLWSLLFVIPGLIKSYSYAMALYIQRDNPNKSANECITESRRIMDGNKWKLFCLDFSYIGWLFLCVLTCGILTLWIAPRMEYAHYLFYLKVSGKGSKEEIMKKEAEQALLEQASKEETIVEEVKEETTTEEVKEEKEYSILEELDKKFEQI